MQSVKHFFSCFFTYFNMHYRILKFTEERSLRIWKIANTERDDKKIKLDTCIINLLTFVEKAAKNLHKTKHLQYSSTREQNYKTPEVVDVHVYSS